MNVVNKAIGKSKAITKQYQPYIEASWGFANHWYPAVFSNELPENDVKGVTICGHEIALRRSEGKVYGIADRCVHRGVRLSARPTCLAAGTITCWYHGFTFDLNDGHLKTIVGSPTDAVIGTVGMRTYPVEEAGGIVFVFVGDETYHPVPPLSSDIPMRITDMEKPVANLLDENVWARGIHRVGQGNWRLAVENGFDPGHLLIHWDNPLILATDRLLPLGVRAISDKAIEVIDLPNGPKGFMNMYNRPDAYEPVVHNPIVNMKARGTIAHAFRTSCYLPGVLLVEHWPLTNYSQYEWYVPIDDKSYTYWEVIVTERGTPEEETEHNLKYENFFEPLGLRDFNDNDLFAREMMAEFYDNRDGWNNEYLCEMDQAVLYWRKVAARFNRGIMEPPAHLQG